MLMQDSNNRVHSLRLELKKEYEDKLTKCKGEMQSEFKTLLIEKENKLKCHYDDVVARKVQDIVNTKEDIQRVSTMHADIKIQLNNVMRERDKC